MTSGLFHFIFTHAKMIFGSYSRYQYRMNPSQSIHNSKRQYSGAENPVFLEKQNWFFKNFPNM